MNIIELWSEAILLAAALSADSFLACFSYGTSGIKVQRSSVWVLNLVCCATLGLSLLAASLVRDYIPQWLTTTVSFILLFLMGLIKLLDSITKSIIRKHRSIGKNIKFSLFNFKFVLTLYADPEKADIDSSRTLSPAEAAGAAFALSLDGMAAGFGAALRITNIMPVFICAAIFNAAAILLGTVLGNKISQKLPFNVSWLGGALLIGMAFMKIL